MYSTQGKTMIADPFRRALLISTLSVKVWCPATLLHTAHLPPIWSPAFLLPTILMSHYSYDRCLLASILRLTHRVVG
jgi:hypothetical protein